jgi:hypothetical protein
MGKNENYVLAIVFVAIGLFLIMNPATKLRMETLITSMDAPVHSIYTDKLNCIESVDGFSCDYQGITGIQYGYYNGIEFKNCNLNNGNIDFKDGSMKLGSEYRALTFFYWNTGSCYVLIEEFPQKETAIPRLVPTGHDESYSYHLVFVKTDLSVGNDNSGLDQNNNVIVDNSQDNLPIYSQDATKDVTIYGMVALIVILIGIYLLSRRK